MYKFKNSDQILQYFYVYVSLNRNADYLNRNEFISFYLKHQYRGEIKHHF